METSATMSRKHAQRGVALIVAIFTLMLVSVVATALILMAGTESAIKANYKSSMHTFYDATAGLEEGRGRLWSANQNSNAVRSCVFPSPGQLVPVGRVCYIVNPSPGEIVNPTSLTTSNPYADFEYQQEWGVPVSAAPGLQPTIISTSPVPSANIVGPLYKWVRIAPWTEAAGNIDINADHDFDNADPLFLSFDPIRKELHTVLSTGGQPVPNASQILSVTALAVMPNGSRRLVQYTVAPVPFSSLNVTLPSALTMVTASGNAPTYKANPSAIKINGNDRSGFNPGACALAPQGAMTGLGITSDPANVNIATPMQPNYLGVGASPSIADISNLLPASEQSVTGLESFVGTITNAASEIVNGPATTLPNYGTPYNPVVAVVQGDLNTSGDVTGYGILLVTGNFTINANFGWRGIVLVIGKGVVDASNTTADSEFDGSFLVATTRDSSGNLLTGLGIPNVNWNGAGSKGIYYDSCWNSNASAGFPYKVLSFREIPQLQ
jgi:hypothetical protein